MEGGLEEPEPEEDPDPEEEDPPVDVDPEVVGGLVDPEELVGGLEEPEEPDELVGGLEVVGGGARRRIEVFTDPLKEAVAAVASRAMSVRRKRMLFSK